MVGEVNFGVEEVSRVPEQFKNVVEHVGHVSIDGGLILQAKDPLSILCEDQEF